MSRHIKLRGVPQKRLTISDSYELVRVTVLEQTHFGVNFGINSLHHSWRYGSLGFVHNGLRLYSNTGGNEPPYGIWIPNEDDGDVKFWCNLLNNPKNANHSFVIPIEQWKMLKEAVEAYNEYFKEQG